MLFKSGVLSPQYFSKTCLKVFFSILPLLHKLCWISYFFVKKKEGWRVCISFNTCRNLKTFFPRGKGWILNRSIEENAETWLPMETNQNVVLPLSQHTSIMEIYLFCLHASSFPLMTKFLSLPKWWYCSGYSYVTIFGRKVFKVDIQCREGITIIQKSDLGNT